MVFFCLVLVPISAIHLPLVLQHLPLHITPPHVLGQQQCRCRRLEELLFHQATVPPHLIGFARKLSGQGPMQPSLCLSMKIVS